MIVDLQNYSEFHAKKAEFSPRWIRLTTAAGAVVIPYNKDLKSLEKHIQEIDKFVNSQSIEPGYYYLDCRRNRKQSGIMYGFSIGNAQKQPPTMAAAPPMYLAETAKQTTIVTDAELLEIRVENERLKLENKRLTELVEELENELEDLQAVELADKPTGTNWAETIKELLPGLADPILGQWKAANDIKAAELAYKYELLKLQQQQPQQMHQAPPQYEETKSAAPTLEELETARQKAPREFYEWLAEPENAAYYEQLKTA